MDDVEIPQAGMQVLDDVSEDEVDEQRQLNALDAEVSPEVRAQWERIMGPLFMDDDPYAKDDPED